MSTEHEHRQLGGYKATLHNPNTSPEAKAHAAEMLASHGIVPDGPDSAVPAPGTDGAHDHNAADGHHAHAHKEGRGDGVSEEEKHEHRVIGGYKGTVHNPNVSSEARIHAQEVLDQHDQHEHRVLGGYKAAVHNPNVSEDAKAHAQHVLNEHGTSA